MSEHAKYNPNFLHHQHSFGYLFGREIVFGMQDGMVSLLGALTGIAIGSDSHFVVVLSGVSIIFTAALSMAIGTYNSVSTEKKIEQRILAEEREEIEKSPAEEKREVEEMFFSDGWPKEIAEKMSEYAAQNNELMLKEMAYRELHVYPYRIYQPIKKSVIMFFVWAFGGLFPLSPYIFLPISLAMSVSVGATIFGLFFLGALMSKFTKQRSVLAGLEMAVIGSLAMLAGYLIGYLSDLFIKGS
jgi:VIT1/CCC1 family predicted Fe2+/Mn2+ transporter